MDGRFIPTDLAENFLKHDDETDAFKWTQNAPINEIPLMFKNYNNERLIACPEESIATFQPVDETDDPREKAMFFLHTYRELANHHKGMPVAISCKISNKEYLMCATSNSSITIKECELPKEIPSKTSEFIFYQKVFSTEQTSFRFESSVNQDFYLAYSTEHHVKKLFLKHCPEGEIDETIMIILEDTMSMPDVS
ncbi:interleukin-18-like isoform X2 [Pseudophryne corroboree]|uniref:interleukin-18-like isoform X2 n=1 Tax=Pseudophryne corroboree TaxID=495146 RepID=UPI00308214A8